MKITLLSIFSFLLSHYCCIYLSFQISFASAKCLVDQQSLLLQLKKNLTFNSEFSTKLKLWNQSIACCNWSGVTCDIEGHVIGLDLSEESIFGGFDNSSSLFYLQHLQKLNLAANKFNSSIPSGFSKLQKLTYLNLSDARFVGQIPIDISKLARLVTLDISINYYSPFGQEMKLENPNLQSLVQNLTSIRKLYLDGVAIRAKGREWSNALLSMRDLQELGMSNCYLSGPLDSSLSRLENLSVIILTGNNFSSPVPETFSNFKNLSTLGLQSCSLTGRFPPKIFQIRTLSFIDLSFNDNLHGVFPIFSPSGSLLSIIVTGTRFSGKLPHSVGNLRHLSELQLSNCQFNGTIPNSLSNLTQLSQLDFSFNNFTGPMPSFGMAKKLRYLRLSQNGLTGAMPSSSDFEGLQNLISIELNNNSISGSIPSSLFNLPALIDIQLSYNQFSKIDEFTNVSSSVLSTLDLSKNHLSGPLPMSFFQLSSLSVLDLSNNKFDDGSLQLDKFFELRNLTTLDLSYNNLSFNDKSTKPGPSSLPFISNLYLGSCNLNVFPSFLRNKSTLSNLDLSHNQIQGTVPNWIWKLQNLLSLNISYNFLTNLEGPMQNLTSNLVILDMHNNKLIGSIPVFSKYAAYLDYSMNKFSSVIPQDIGKYMSSTYYLSLSNNAIHGSIPNSLCNASNLQVLALSNNNISGTIPSCLITMTNILYVLDIRKNNITGPIPDLFPASCALTTFNLQGNLLHGTIPKSLVHCSKLQVFDIGSNEILGGFPCFLKNIPALRVLVLRNNKFQGSIRCSEENRPWKLIQIVDIGFNNFSGKLPKSFFTTWETMMHDDEDHTVSDYIYTRNSVYYQDEVTVSSKGQQMELVKILTIFTAIDFSSNHFEGPIPEILMDFKALYILNFSNNDLSGQISSSIGNLKQLESLDLANNSLVGEIPVQIASLSFLSYLNLSFNHLVGKIPTGTQLQSFQASSYEGNHGLYGPPLTENPDEYDKDKGFNLLPQPSCRGLPCSIEWNFLSIELGTIFGLGIFIGPLIFWKKWRECYWKLVDKILCLILPWMHLESATLRGQKYTVLKWKWH